MKKIIALTLSSLLCISAVGCSSKKNNSDIVATVNGNNITVKQFESTLALYKESLEAMYGSTIWDTEVEAGVKYKDKFKDIMLDQMIDIEAVCEQARKDKLAPSEEEVDKAFEELKKNIDADEEYKKKLEGLGIDDTYLRSQQEQDLTIQKYKENFDKNLKSDEEMKKYYEEHKADYYKDEVKASHILISTVDDNGKELSEAKKKEAKKKAEEREQALYESNFTGAVLCMWSGSYKAQEACSLIHDVWYDTIYEKDESSTRKYVSGHSDFNDSLEALFKDKDFKEEIDDLRNSQDEVRSYMKSLTNPSDEYKQGYEALLEFYNNYITLTNLAIDPTGTLTTYTQDVNEMISTTSTNIETMKLYIDTDSEE